MKNTILLILLSFILLPSGMKGQAEIVLGSPEFEMITKSLEYGNVIIGKEYILPVRIKNSGVLMLSLFNVIIEYDTTVFVITNAPKISNPISIYPNDTVDIQIKFKPLALKEYKSKLFIKSDDYKSYLDTLIITGTGIKETNSSVQEIADIESLSFQTIDEGNSITFSIITESVFEDGTFAIYSQEGKLIKSIVVSSNSTELSVSISKSEVPKLSLIRFTQGEKTYVHKHLRE